MILVSRLIVKVKYHNPKTSSANISGYAEYIAKREGVELRNQDMKRPVGTTYADYIATRPGVETRGSHGLFSIEDRPISLKDVSDELKNYKGNVWTVILSLRREDATSTCYDNSEAWRELITEKADEIAKCFNIPINELNCYAAFHDADDHPHIHMMVYSKNPSVYGGYHKETSLQHMKSVFTREIFREELSEIYQSKTQNRDQLRSLATDKIRELAEKISTRSVSGTVVDKFVELSKQLSFIEGRKVYGFLPSELKSFVDEILKEIAKDPVISEAYNLWYEQKEKVDAMYSSHSKERVPIEQNKEFLSIRNAIVRQAIKLNVKNEQNNPVTIQSANFALDELLMMLSTSFGSKADELDLEQNSVTERQIEVDRALGIRHEYE